MKSFHARHSLFAGLFVTVLAGLPADAAAQGTAADYARADTLRARYESAAIDIAGPATAIGRTHRFWYRKSIPGGDVFMTIDADTRQKQPAFDHASIARSLSDLTGNRYSGETLPFNSVAFTDEGTAFTVSVEGAPYRCEVSAATCRKADAAPRVGAGLAVGRRGRDEGPRRSPDGQWEALINNYNLAVRKRGTRALVHLSSDGSEANYYELSSIAWSPDSRKVAVYRVRPGYRREVHYVESSPDDQLQPKYSSLLYAKPGDVLDVDQPVLFTVEPRQQVIVDNTLFPNAYANSELVWRNDSRAVTFEYNQRGHQVYRIIEIDAASGRARAVISEEPKTFFTYRTANGALSDSARSTASTSMTARRSSGCLSATAGTTCTCSTASAAR